MYHFTMLHSISKKLSYKLSAIKKSNISFSAFVLLISLLSFTSQKTAAQTVGDYRSIITGTFVAWNNLTFWFLMKFKKQRNQAF